MSDQAPLILIVDDDEDGRMLTRLALEHGGLRVAEADSAATGLALLAAEQPALVLLDAVMPGMDGFTACAGLRSRFPALPVAMLTGLDDPVALERARHAGACALIRKSFAWTELAGEVWGILRQQTALAPKPGAGHE